MTVFNGRAWTDITVEDLMYCRGDIVMLDAKNRAKIFPAFLYTWVAELRVHDDIWFELDSGPMVNFLIREKNVNSASESFKNLFDNAQRYAVFCSLGYCMTGWFAAGIYIEENPLEVFGDRLNKEQRGFFEEKHSHWIDQPPREEWALDALYYWAT